MSFPSRTIPTLLLALAAALPGQDDTRDVLTRRDGKTFTGRLLTPHSSDELLLLQGGKRVRLARGDLASTDLVADRVAEFCDRRLRMKAPKAQWFLVEWAAAHGLPGLARAQAMLLALDDDSHTAAHEFLGHKPTAKGWLWEHDGRNITRDQLEVAMAKHPFDLVGERFRIRSQGGLRQSVAALLDLEQLAVVFHQRFGAPLQLQESLQPIAVEIARNGEEFPKWGFRPIPYYKPAPHGDVALTFFAGPAPERPHRLFFVGAHALLYHTLIGEVARQNDRDRINAWLEVGLAMHFENSLQGPAGFAAPGPLRAQDLQALQALGRDYRLTQLQHLPMYGGFYLLDDTNTAVAWGASTMFVAWLLEPDNDPKTREPFLAFVRESLGERKGDSSSAFDRLLGRRVEELEVPFTKWLAKRAGF